MIKAKIYTIEGNTIHEQFSTKIFNDLVSWYHSTLDNPPARHHSDVIASIEFKNRVNFNIFCILFSDRIKIVEEKWSEWSNHYKNAIKQ